MGINIVPKEPDVIISDVYAREPIGFSGPIPLFSEPNDYTDNYERISSEHLTSLRRDGTNPFMPEDVWNDMENSTIELVKKYANPGDMILDVGVGLGRLLSHFPDLKRYGIDISLGYLEEAHKKKIEVCYAMVEEMPYKPEIFDIVVCTDVLEHVLDLNLSVKKILSTLKKGGYIVVRVPHEEKVLGYLKSPYKYIHMRSFDEGTLRLLFERIFCCEHVETILGTYWLNGGYVRFHLPFSRLHHLTAPLVRLTAHCNVALSDALLRRFYRPLEINLVFRKT